MTVFVVACVSRWTVASCIKLLAVLYTAWKEQIFWNVQRATCLVRSVTGALCELMTLATAGLLEHA